MMTRTFRTWVQAELQTVWSVVSDSVENPQMWVRDEEESDVLERLEGGIIEETKIRAVDYAPGGFAAEVLSFVYESEIVRKVTVLGKPYKERVLISKEEKEIRRELIDPPACAGKITVKVAPLSVQNPMAPVDLQFFLELDFEKEMDIHEEEMVSAIKEEQQQLKERAEMLEMRS